MKKIIAFVMAATMATSLVACGSSSEAASSVVSDSSAVSSSEVSETDISNDKADSESASPTPTPEKAVTYDPDFQAQTIVDNDTCTIELQGVGYDDDYGYYWKLYFKNKTSDKKLDTMPSCEELNGMDADLFWMPSVEPGQEETDEVQWDAAGLKIYGIKPQDINTVNVHFDVYDDAEWNVDFREDPVNDDFVIYPKGEENATPVKHEIQPTDLVLIDNDSCRFVICGYDPDGTYGYTAKAYIENKLDEDIGLRLDRGSINGFECSPDGAMKVEAGTNDYTDIYWYDYIDTYEAGGKDPTSIKGIVMPVTIETFYNSNVLGEGTFTIDPQTNTLVSN